MAHIVVGNLNNSKLKINNRARARKFANFVTLSRQKQNRQTVKPSRQILLDEIQPNRRCLGRGEVGVMKG